MLRKFGFSKKEIKDIVISTLILGFVFFYPGLSLFKNLNLELFIEYLLYSFIVMLAFIPHELAHKFMAMKYGCFAQYQMWKTGLKFALLLAILTNGNFVIAAPGAVVISTTYLDLWGIRHIALSRKQNGYISASGPVANLIVALLAILFFKEYAIAGTIAYINAFLAFFNLLPIPPLDGSKVMAWDMKIWAALLISAFLIMSLI